MSLLELDPNIVKPGWTPLLILIGLALVMALLFRSMRRQFHRVDQRWPDAAAEAAARRGTDRTEGPLAPGSTAPTTPASTGPGAARPAPADPDPERAGQS